MIVLPLFHPSLHTCIRTDHVAQAPHSGWSVNEPGSFICACMKEAGEALTKTPLTPSHAPPFIVIQERKARLRQHAACIICTITFCFLTLTLRSTNPRQKTLRRAILARISVCVLTLPTASLPENREQFCFVVVAKTNTSQPATPTASYR